MSYRYKLRWIRYESRRILLLLTCIGVIVHEYAHKHFCDYYRIPVKETVYFQLDDPPGYVTHAQPKRYLPGFMISIAPAFINSIAAVLAGFAGGYLLTDDPGISSFMMLALEMKVVVIVLLWFGISAGVHLLPSQQDAKEVWGQTRQNWYNPLVLAVIPVTFLFEVLNRLRLLYIDVIVGIALVVIGVYFGVNDYILVNMLENVIDIEGLLAI